MLMMSWILWYVREQTYDFYSMYYSLCERNPFLSNNSQTIDSEIK